jgi:CheY-like chemotaxis protein
MSGLRRFFSPTYLRRSLTAEYNFHVAFLFIFNFFRLKRLDITSRFGCSGRRGRARGVEKILRVLIVEDDISDIRSAAAVFKRLGVPDADVEAVRSVAVGVLRLQDAVDGLRPPPYLVLLDLDFTCESGFEILRFWRSNPKLKQTRIMVWTSMGDRQVEISRLFGVDVVRKGSGIKDLDESLRRYFPAAGQNSAIG